MRPLILFLSILANQGLGSLERPRSCSSSLEILKSQFVEILAPPRHSYQVRKGSKGASDFIEFQETGSENRILFTDLRLSARTADEAWQTAKAHSAFWRLPTLNEVDALLQTQYFEPTALAHRDEGSLVMVWGLKREGPIYVPTLALFERAQRQDDDADYTVSINQLLSDRDVPKPVRIFLVYDPQN